MQVHWWAGSKRRKISLLSDTGFAFFLLQKIRNPELSNTRKKTREVRRKWKRETIASSVSQRRRDGTTRCRCLHRFVVSQIFLLLWLPSRTDIRSAGLLVAPFSPLCFIISHLDLINHPEDVMPANKNISFQNQEKKKHHHHMERPERKQSIICQCK